MACRAFNAIKVDTSDLGNVPDSLRHILEATLSQEASSENLEKYLPRIRDIIINLLHGLKRKQQKLRQKQSRSQDPNAPPERTTSVSTVASGTSGLTNMLDEGIESGGYEPEPSRGPQHQGSVASSISRRSNNPRSEIQRSESIQSISNVSSVASTPMQNIPVLPSYPSNDNAGPALPAPTRESINIDAFPPPPPPPPDQQSSALAALQKGGDLERRASRRYSQYQISKHLGGANGVPILPPQNTPVPNRGGGREARESLRAVQTRETVRHSRHTSNQQKSSRYENSPARVPDAVAEEASVAATPVEQNDTPIARSPEDKFRPSATLRGPPSDPMFTDMTLETPTDEKTANQEVEPNLEPEKSQQPKGKPVLSPLPSSEPKANESYFQVSPPPTPTKELTLFLQYKSKVKKFVLPDGWEELTLGRLQLAFIEKFSWNTQQNGADLPEIYIQDPVSGVRHELEDLSDIKDRTVLVLNVEPLDEVKRHFDDGLSALTKIVKEVKQNVDDQGSALQRVSDRQQETTAEMARLAAAPPPTTIPQDGSKPTFGTGRRLNAGQAGELQSLRRDLAVLRQTYSKFQDEVQNSMSTLRQKAANVKTATARAAIPDFDGDAGYSYVTSGRKQLNKDSDHLVGKVDDLQDLIEDLRKDVVHRGVRPLPRQLEDVSKDITNLSKELKRMDDYMKQEKPIWTKIWEKELEDVCQGRDELRLMEDLMVDLKDDLDKASETFTLVEQATKEQMKDNGTNAAAGSARQFSKGLNNLGNSLDQNAAKDGVLSEVRALQPNHEDRLEAIERAEKLRMKELQGRGENPLHKEMKGFVAGGKLKKSGGFEEVERARKAKDDRIRREVWERQNGIVADEFDEEEFEEGEEEEDAEGDEAEVLSTEDAPSLGDGGSPQLSDETKKG